MLLKNITPLIPQTVALTKNLNIKKLFLFRAINFSLFVLQTFVEKKRSFNPLMYPEIHLLKIKEKYFFHSDFSSTLLLLVF